MLKFRKRLALMFVVGLIASAVFVSCGKSTTTDENAATEHPADSTAAEHPAADSEHPTDSDSTEHPEDTN